MIRAIRSAGAIPAVIELDEHVPFTITWQEGAGLGAAPIYGRVRDVVDGILELRFSPSTFHLVEAVLVNAPHVSFTQQVRLPSGYPRTQATVVLDGSSFDSGHDLNVTAYSDVLLASWSQAPVVDFSAYGDIVVGLGASDEVMALGFSWLPGQRDEFASLWQRTGPADSRAMTHVNFLAMRLEIIEAMRSLSDVEHQRLQWGNYDPEINYYDDLRLNLQMLYDDTAVLPDPAASVPDLLHASEVDALAGVDLALRPMMDDLGAADDSRYTRDPRWAGVVSAAAQALDAMRASDEGA